MNPVLNPRRTAHLLAAIALAGSGACVAAEAAGAGSAGPQREYIYGAELMTPQERERYRARQRGVTLEEPAGVLRRPEEPR